MQRINLDNELIQMIKQVKEDNTLEIDCHTSLVEDIGLDSIELINLILEIEERFHVEIDFDDFEYGCLESFNEFANFIDTAVKEHNE